MNRIDCILEDEDFKYHLKATESLEKERIFCHHDINHFMDVSRVAYIINLEKGYLIDKELIYATGLLHDIGRWVEYKEGKDHAIASAELAQPILERCGFSKTEIEQVLSAIKAHRQKEQSSHLGAIIYEADKTSRPCYNCNARGQCKRFINGEKFNLKY